MDNCEFDSIIKAICPHCHRDMEICKEAKTYCEYCDFSWNGKDPCRNCFQYIPSLRICKVGGFKKEGPT